LLFYYEEAMEYNNADDTIKSINKEDRKVISLTPRQIFLLTLSVGRDKAIEIINNIKHK
jgi:hypothetical protein